MPQYNDTLERMVNRVLQAKPNAQQSEVVRMLNGRIRQVINSRIYWADLLVWRSVGFITPYTTGTVSTVFNSTAVTGVSTVWPVSDAVNTTSNTAVVDFGYQEITPASMTGITVDTYLYADSGGTPEIVSVVEITPVSFWAKFASTHTTGFTLTSSSLAGKQISFGQNFPIFTVQAITTATTLTMDQPWGGPALIAGSTYEIYQGYITIDPNLKVIVDVVDQQAGRSLDFYAPDEVVNITDPQRSSTGDPLAFVQKFPTPSGSMQYEVWPVMTSARQLAVLCGLQWPELKLQNDRPPWFIDPNLYVEGAIADALRIKNIRSVMDQDPWFNPQLAMQYEQLYQMHLQQAVNADEAKAQRSFQHAWDNLLAAGGANFWKQHDPDLNAWRM